MIWDELPLLFVGGKNAQGGQGSVAIDSSRCSAAEKMRDKGFTAGKKRTAKWGYSLQKKEGSCSAEGKE